MFNMNCGTRCVVNLSEVDTKWCQKLGLLRFYLSECYIVLCFLLFLQLHKVQHRHQCY